MFRHLLMALVLAALFLPAVGLATEIAQISQTAGGNNYILHDSGTSETFTATTEVAITFYLAGAPVGQDGLLTLNATTYTTATNPGGNYFSEGGFSGNFSIIDNTAGPDNGRNLLSGSFGSTYGTISGSGYSMTFADSTPGDSVVLSSFFLDFMPSNTQSFSFSLSNIEDAEGDPETLGFGAGGFLADNTSAGGATFAATPPPVIAPEPTTLLLSGGALLGMGFLLRKRKSRRVF